MTPFAQLRIEIPDEVLMRDLQGEAVILNLDSECYFGLDEVGTRMWAALTTAPTVQAALDQLIDEFEVGSDSLRSDVETFIASLAEAGLVRVRPA